MGDSIGSFCTFPKANFLFFHLPSFHQTESRIPLEIDVEKIAIHIPFIPYIGANIAASGILSAVIGREIARGGSEFPAPANAPENICSHMAKNILKAAIIL